MSISDRIENKNKQRKIKSLQQERKFAKKVKGKPTPSSGAKMKQNDVRTRKVSYELKYTEKQSYTLKVSELQKMMIRAGDKIPVFVIEFEEIGEFAVIPLKYLESFLNK